MQLLAKSISGETVVFEADGHGIGPDTSFWKQGSGGIGAKSATAVSGAATLNKENGLITSESLSTAAGAEYTLTITSRFAQANDFVFANVTLGSATTGAPIVRAITVTAGTIVIIVRNIHASAALNGTIKIGYFTMRA